MPQSNFSIIDAVILIIYILFSVGLGFFLKRYISSIKDYITAGQFVRTGLGTATLAGTETGLITIMYAAQKGFSGGFAAFHIGFIAMIITFLVGATGFIVAPLRRTGVLTIPEFYRKRFNKRVQILGAIILSIGGILNMGLFLKVGAIFIVGITGTVASPGILTWVMVGLLALTIVYTMFGGMVSVIITDYIQYVIMAFGLIIVCGIAISQLGWSTIFDTIYTQFGDAGFNPLSNGNNFGIWYILWMIVTAGLVSCAIWPTAVARALACDNEKTVKKQTMLSAVSFLIRFMIPNFLGICAWVYFFNQDQLTSLFASNSSLSSLYALPLFLGHLLPVGILGLLTAGFLAAFMSTHDSYLLCWSSVITRDIVLPLSKRPLSTKTQILLTRLFIVLIGCYVVYWGVFYQGTEDVWDYLAITGAIYFSGAFAVLIGGLYWPKASNIGAMLSLCFGFSALFGLAPIKNYFSISLSGAQIGLCSITLTSLAMVFGSLVFPNKTKASL